MLPAGFPNKITDIIAVPWLEVTVIRLFSRRQGFAFFLNLGHSTLKLQRSVNTSCTGLKRTGKKTVIYPVSPYRPPDRNHREFTFILVGNGVNQTKAYFTSNR